MGTFGLVLVIVLVPSAIVLLFPFVFWVEFHACRTGAEVKLFLFKRLLWTYEKAWKENSDVDEVPKLQSEPKVETKEAPKTEVETKTESKAEIKAEIKVEEKIATQDKPQEAPLSAPKAESKEEAKDESKVEIEPEPKGAPEEEKKSLTEREFWTLLLTPDFDERGLRYFKKILDRFLVLFRVRFVDCFVEGIRMDYRSMGYGAAFNAIMKGYPFLKDWDLRMDWTRDHDLQAAGKVRASINLCRTLWFLSVSSVRLGVMAFIFWRRRAAVLKTGLLPELGYVRKKILDWLVEE